MTARILPFHPPANILSTDRGLFSLADEYPRWMKVEFIVNRGEVKWRGWIESSREKMVSRVKEEAGEDLPSDRGETSRYSLSSTDVFH